LKRVDTLLYVVADKAYLQDTADFIIDTMRILFDNTTAARSGINSCYMLTIIKLINNFSLRHTMPYNRKSVQNYNKFLTYARKSNFFSLFSLIICAREIFLVSLHANLRIFKKILNNT
jgi:hypothetical protein